MPRNLIAVTLLAAFAAAMSGCAGVSSTLRRTGMVGLGAAAGGTAAYAAFDHQASKAVLGAIAGATITSLAQGEDGNVRQAGFDAGYVRGESDAIKREYFLRHDREAQPAESGGQTVYYTLPGPEVTVDGRKLEPHRVAVPVIE